MMRKEIVIENVGAEVSSGQVKILWRQHQWDVGY